MRIGFGGFLAGDMVTIEHQGQAQTIEKWGDPAVDLMAYGGRVNEFASLASVSGAPLVQQHDGTAILDLSGVTAATVLNGALANGRPAKIAVSHQVSRHGWAPADYYMLERGTDGDLVIEPGEYHREIWVSRAPAAWTVASIAAAEGLATSAITGAWLLAHPTYGGSEAQKVSLEVAMMIHSASHAAKAGDDRIKPSNWMYFERGHDYTGLAIGGNIHGESPLHPNRYMAFGTGTEPTGIVFGGSKAFYPSNHAFEGVPVLTPNTRNFENLLVADTRLYNQWGSNAEMAAGLTLYRTRSFDVAKSAPADGRTAWAGGSVIGGDARWDRESGIYVANVLGTLLLDTFWDKDGWVQDAVVDGTWNNGQYGQPPSIYNHNIYMAEANADQCFDGLLSMRSASVAAQMRVGGWYLNATSIDNQLAFQNAGTRNPAVKPSDASNSNYGFSGLNLRCVATSGRNSPYIGAPGARTYGFDWQGPQPTDVDCMALHVSDPANPAEIAAKGNGEPAFSRLETPFWSNMAVRRWNGDLNLAGLSTALIDTITIQRRAAQLLGQQTATITDYANYCRSLSPRALQLEIKAVNRYLLAARKPTLLLPLDDRTAPQTLIFKPDWRGEGFRSDNPLNWSSKDTPIDGDSLNLHGNRVKWVKDTTSVAAVTFGSGGRLIVSSGKLTAGSHVDAAKVEVTRCGKYHAPATSGDYTVRGGRLVLTAAATVGIEASGQGQVILGPNCTVPSGKKLRIVGDMGKVGWDATSGTASLTIASGATLEFHATPVVQFEAGGMDMYRVLLTKMLGQTSGATGEWDSWRRRDLDLVVRVRDMAGTPVVGEIASTAVYTHPAGGAIKAVLPAVIGQIRCFRSGRFGTTAPGVTGTVTLAAGSQVVISNRALLAPGTYDLTGPGVTVVNQGATLPAGVSITGGKLVLTI